MSCRIFVASLLVVCMCMTETHAVENDAAYSQLVVKVCTKNQYSLDCARAVEAFQLQSGGNRYAKRTGNSLVVRLNGKAAVLTDAGVTEDEAGDNTILYSYIDYLPDMRLHIVGILFYEGSAFLAIHHDSGQKVYPHGFPVVSPDLQRFVATSCDLVARFDPNNIEIWRSSNGNLFLEWSQAIEEWGPTKARWLAPDWIRVEKLCLDENVDEYPCGTVDLVREGGQWKFVQ